MNVSAKTQQRLVQRYLFDPPTVNETNNSPEPIRSSEAVSFLKAVSEVSLDGGMVRLVPPPGVKLDKSLWQQYKAVCLDQSKLSSPMLLSVCAQALSLNSQL